MEELIYNLADAHFFFNDLEVRNIFSLEILSMPRCSRVVAIHKSLSLRDFDRCQTLLRSASNQPYQAFIATSYNSHFL